MNWITEAREAHEGIRADRDLHSHMMVVATRAAGGKASKETLRAVCRAIAADKNLMQKLAGTVGVGGTDHG